MSACADARIKRSKKERGASEEGREGTIPLCARRNYRDPRRIVELYIDRCVSFCLWKIGAVIRRIKNRPGRQDLTGRPSYTVVWRAFNVFFLLLFHLFWGGNCSISRDYMVDRRRPISVRVSVNLRDNLRRIVKNHEGLVEIHSSPTKIRRCALTPMTHVTMHSRVTLISKVFVWSFRRYILQSTLT